MALKLRRQAEMITNENLPHRNCWWQSDWLGTGAASFKRLLGARCWMLMSVMRCPRIVKDAGGITEYPIPSLESARRWLPASREPCIQKLPVRRLATPDGDRRHRSQSGCVIH